MNNFPETIFEIYDDEPIYNILSIVHFKPKKAIYLCPQNIDIKKIKDRITTCLKHLNIDTECVFHTADMLSVDSVTTEIERILSLYGNMPIDISGGSEVALVSLGVLAKEKELSLFKYDRGCRCFRNIHHCPELDGVSAEFRLNIKAFLALSGCAVKSHGHVSVDSLDEEAGNDIYKVWNIYTSHLDGWHRTVSYLQHITKNAYSDDLYVSAKSVLFGEATVASADKSVLQALSDAGIILDYQNTPKSIRFSYKNRLMKSCLTDIGICLELYVYAVAKKSELFDDVMISVVIDWDGEFHERINTLNEIDVFITKDIVPMFISCKSGTPNVTALNEIRTLSDKFGGVSAKAVLVTMADVRSKDPYLARRAEDMGVALIDRSDLLSDSILKRLRKIAKG